MATVGTDAERHCTIEVGRCWVEPGKTVEGGFRVSAKLEVCTVRCGDRLECGRCQNDRVMVQLAGASVTRRSFQDVLISAAPIVPSAHCTCAKFVHSQAAA